MKAKKEIIWFESVDSTNDQARRIFEELPDHSVLAARQQTAGRGQRSNIWLTEGGKNLTFTIVLKNLTGLKAKDQFELSQLTALSVVDFLALNNIEAWIKLPNDIYVGSQKICGILIENTLRGDSLCSSIIGIGLNVNQTVFDPSLPNPVSMALCNKEKAFDIDECLESLTGIFFSKYYAFISEITD